MGIFLGLLIIGGVVFLLMGSNEVTDIKVPDVYNMTIDEAISELERVGFNYTTETASSDSVESGKVIRTKPAKGSTRKKGSTIIIVESTGTESIVLEDYTKTENKYFEVKAKLERIGINVLIEKKSVENVEDYEGKEDLIIDQEPKVSEDGTEIRLEKGDNITLYIPDVAETYPDMVTEGWTLSEAEAFAQEYGVTLDVEYVETDEYEPNIVIYQSRGVGDRIIKGITLRIKVSKEKSEPIEDLLPSDDENKTEENKNDNESKPNDNNE